MQKFSRKIFVLTLLGCFLFSSLVFADSEGQIKKFFVNPGYEFQSREEIQAVLKKVSQKAYFYLDQEWFQGLSKEKKEKALESLEILAKEFDETIYPELTSFFGQEWSPGIDNDYRITILFHQMKEGMAGYFDSSNEYPKIQSPKSNEREMVYLAADYLFYPIIKAHLSHEFLHLITYNQKDRLRGVTEEVWLNEARADFAPTFLGYDKNYQESNLRQRFRAFIENPSDSLTEWQNQKKDYGVANIFIQYLVDHYGPKILADSLTTRKAGIPSLNLALRENNIEKS